MCVEICVHKVLKSNIRMKKYFKELFFYPMDANQNTPLNFYQVKMWFILAGQQSQCTYIKLKIKACTEPVQEGTFR